MKSKIFNKRNILTFIFAFITCFVLKTIGNKFIGGAYSLEKAYSWDKIIDELPSMLLLSVYCGVLLTIAAHQDRKNH